MIISKICAPLVSFIRYAYQKCLNVKFRAHGWLLAFRYGWAGEIKQPLDNPKKRVLALPTGHYEFIFIYSVLGKAMQAIGTHVSYLLHDPNHAFESYLKSLGHKHFLYFSDTKRSDQAESLAQELLLGVNAIDVAICIQYRGVDVGRHMLSTVVRSKNIATLDFTDSETQRAIKLGLVNSIRATDFAYELLERQAFDQVLVSEKGYTPYAEVYNVALIKHIEVIHLYVSHLEDSLLLRRFDLDDMYEHHFSLAPQTWEKVRIETWSESDGEALKRYILSSYDEGLWWKRKKTQIGKRNLGREELFAQYGLDYDKKTAVIFSHVLFDATFWYGTNLFKDYAEWLIESIRVAVRNDNVNWLVKMHPDNAWKIQNYSHQSYDEYQLILKAFPELPSHVKLILPEDEVSTVSLLSNIDYAITVRGTVGLEFPCFGIPAFTAGTGRYSGRGFTIDSSSKEEYLRKLMSIECTPQINSETISVAQKYSNAVFRRRALQITSFKWYAEPKSLSTSLFWPTIRFQINSKSVTEFMNSKDIRAFVSWLDRPEEVDFLETRS